MQPVMQREPEPVVQEEILELPSHSSLPRLDLGVEWPSPWAEFRSSWHDYFKGPKAPADATLPADADLKVEWIEGRLSKRGYAFSAAWHVLAVVLICLPIWHFLAIEPKPFVMPEPQLTWTNPSADLPPIALKGPDPKPSPKGDAAKPLAQKGADAFHPRQTILAEPVRVTHPRQTLIQPDAPPTPPKIDPQLPNVVEWAGAPTQAPPKLQIAPTVAQARIQRRSVTDVAAPEVANDARNAGSLNIAPSPTTVAAPKLPVNAMSAAVTKKREQTESAAAPEVGAASSGDSSLHHVIALSAAPAPPAPEVNVPQGNLAAHVAISPDGKQPGAPGGAEHGVASNGGANGNPTSNGGAGKTGGGNASSLPAAVSVTGGNSRAGNGGTGASTARPATKLNLKPMATPDSALAPRRSPSTIGAIDPRLPPETVLSGKEIFTMHIDMPNLTSFSGSWIVKFAQLEDGNPPYHHDTGVLSGPAPEVKVDPKYPQTLIKERVDGEVVLYAIIRKDGTVDSIQIIRSLDPQLDKNSMDALARWVFRPATREGKPVDCEAVIHIPFRFRPD
jgi:TonB family protein